MATIVFLLKRFVAQRLLGLAIVVTLAFTVGVLVAGPIYAEAAREAILSSALSTAPVQIKNVRFATYGDAEFAWVDADAIVQGATAGLPVMKIVRQGRATIRLEAGAEPISVPVLFRDGAADHLPFKGEPPEGPGEMALPVTVARFLDIRVGDAVTVTGPTGVQAELDVTGTFGDPDRGDPFWYGPLIPFPSQDSTELPPVLLDRSGYLPLAKDVDLVTEFVWDDYLTLEAVPFVGAERIPGLIRQANDQLRLTPEFRRLRTTSGLATLMELVRQRIANLRVPIYLVVFQIGAVTLAVLAGVGSLTLTRQSFELAVLRSRGFSRGKLIAAQGVQAVLSAAVAFPLGLLIGVALARLASESNGPSLPGVLFPVRITGIAQILGLVGAALGALILLLLSLPHVARTILEERRLLSREARPLLARYPVEAFVAPLGIFAFIEVRNRGFLPVTQRGSLDPLVLLAPTLLLFAASFLALRLLLLLLRRFDRSIGRVRSLPLYLAGRRLGRSPGASFATSLLLVLSVGLLVVSTSYRAIVIRNHEDSAHQQVGSDWNIQVAAPEQTLLALQGVPPGMTPVVRTQPSFETGSFPTSPTALGIDPATFASGGWWREDYSDMSLAEILSRLQSPVPGQPLPPGAGTLRATVDATKEIDGLVLLATVEGPGARVSVLSMGALRPGANTYEVGLEGADRVLSIAVQDPGTRDLPGKVRLTIEGVEADSQAVSLSGWEPIGWRSSEGMIRPEGGGLKRTIRRGAGHGIGGIAPALGPLPALASPGIVASQGEVFEATVGAQLLEFRTVAEADAFPTVSGEFIVVSTPALLSAAARIPEAGLSLSEMWAMGDRDPRPALSAASFIVGRTQNAAPIVAILSQLPQSLAVGMHFAAAAGGLGLVVIGVAVGLYFGERRREFEFASLRGMGTEPGQISRVLLLEQSLLIGFAIVAGAGLGFAILRLMIPYVGKSLGAAFPAPVLVVDWRSLGISWLAIVLATGIGLLAALRALLRSSVTSVLRGEAE
ncbi:MAG: FtsX-like permease family protein [Actinomycetota bacterium]